MSAPTPADRDRLVELAATNLGVIEHLGLVFGAGMTAITGETGAGKTLLVTALELLLGGRADAAVVGPHGDEAVVEARFVLGNEELVLQRVVPREGRSRAYLNGRLATAATLAESGTRLVELHGQHGHTTLGSPAAQRSALDRFGRIDHAPLVEARLAVKALETELAGLGGDARARVRELELLSYQLSEIDAAAIADPDEDDRLQMEEQLLGSAESARRAIGAAVAALGADGPAEEAVSGALVELESVGAFDDLVSRLRNLAAELADIASDARQLEDRVEENPERLAQIQERRRLLTDLRRKYGETLGDVLAYHAEILERVEALENHDRRATEVDRRLDDARQAAHAAAQVVGDARRRAAPELARAVTANVRALALPNAVIECHVGDGAGDDVELRVSMNRGAPVQPLSKVASGGELARTMLALRLVLAGDPATMVFDEVDAGVGGQAAQAVGAALARLADTRQVIVVTHLAQVAAHADHHVTVVKDDSGRMVSVSASLLDREARIVELSRMLSGSPDSDSAREHAAELLAGAAAARPDAAGPSRRAQRAVG